MAQRSPWLLLVLLCGLGFGQGWGRPSDGTAAGEREALAEVRAQALERFPGPMRMRLETVPVVREARFELPEGAPLSLELVAAAAQGAFELGPRRVVLYDAGWAGGARWSRDLDGPEDRARLGALLDDLAPLLGAPAGAHGELWERFAARVRKLAGRESGPEGAAPPVFGSAEVFDALLDAGVRRLLGGELDRVGLLVHELAHAVQLGGKPFESRAHVLHWGSLSGWAASASGEPTDGTVGGFYAVERAEVLLRLILADEEAPLDRLRDGAFYLHHSAARFVNRYAAHDPREDFAESLRRFVDDPRDLFARAPQKFLFLNAVGWCLDLDIAAPGPLWIDGERLAELGGAAALAEVAARLLAPGEGEPAADLEVRAALVRAHAEVLAGEDLGAPHGQLAPPADLPEPVLRAVDPELLTVRVGERVYPPEPGALATRWARELVHHAIRAEAGPGIFAWLLHRRPDAAALARLVAEIEGFGDAEERFGRWVHVLACEGHWAADAEALAAAGRRERERLVAEGRPLWGARIELLLARGDPRLGAEERLRAAREALERALGEASPSAEHVELAALAAGVLLRAELAADPAGTLAGDPARGPARWVDSVPGETLGALRRVELWSEAARTLEGNGHDPAPAVARARAEADRIAWPALRSYARGRVP